MIAKIVEDLKPLARPLEDLVLDPANARLHGQRNLDAIMHSLKTFGQRKPIVVNGVNKTVEAGNGTVEAAIALGWTHLAQVWVRDDAHTQTGFALADNRTSELAEWDDETLAKHLKELGEAHEMLDWDPVDLGWSDDEMKELLDSLEPEPPGGGGDNVGARPENPQSELGAIYQLGPHKLYCGDAREVSIGEAFGSGPIDMVWTDPPYAVAFQKKQQHLDQQDPRPNAREQHKIEGDELTPEELKALVTRVLSNALESSARGAPIYCCGPPGDNLRVMLTAFADAGWRLQRQLIAVKQNMVLGRADYHSRYEPILYGWKPGAAHRWYGGRDKQDVFEVIFPQGYLVRQEARHHPNRKPVNLIEQHVRNSSRLHEVVYDPFAGSGSTMIACVRTGRIAWMCEIDPGYCDVIRKRYGDYARGAGAAPGKDAL